MSYLGVNCQLALDESEVPVPIVGIFEERLAPKHLLPRPKVIDHQLDVARQRLGLVHSHEEQETERQQH